MFEVYPLRVLPHRPAATFVPTIALDQRNGVNRRTAEASLFWADLVGGGRCSQARAADLFWSDLSGSAAASARALAAEDTTASSATQGWQRPTSVDEALELFSEARRRGEARPPDEANAKQFVDWVDDFIAPLIREDRFNDQFPIHGGLSRFRDAYERRGAWAILAGAAGYLRTVRQKLAFGATVGGWWPAAETALEANRYFLEVLNGEGVSAEIRDAPRYRARLRLPADAGLTHAEVRMRVWLKKHRDRFERLESRWGVDRRAIAGAIAWEALENRQFVTLSSVGPGKVHVPFRMFGVGLLHRETFAQQVEASGYLPPKSEADRNALLATFDGAGLYIGAMMRAAADLAWKELQADIFGDPAMLCWVYNSHDLVSWKARIAEKRVQGATAPFRPIGDMSKWVTDKIDYLQRAVGKPEHVIRPIPAGGRDVIAAR